MKKQITGSRFVTLDADEFHKVCQRVHGLLTTRVQKAWDKHSKHPSEKSSDNHIETSKDAFAFIHLLELVEHMTEEIHDLRMAVAVGVHDDDVEFINPTLDRSKKYLN